MENEAMEMNNIEEIETNVEEVEGNSGDSTGGGFLAGIVGGFLAYAVIGGAKKLRTIIVSKLEERRQKKETAKSESSTVVDVKVDGSETEVEHSVE